MKIEPKEKALELFRKFVIKHNLWTENKYTMSKTIPQLKKELFNTQWFTPKEMTLMCVDEILNVVDETSKPYWIEVRTCIAAF